MELKIFKDFDFSDFWDDSEYALSKYVVEEFAGYQFSYAFKRKLMSQIRTFESMTLTENGH